jgi:predicted aspartyl protease
MGVSKTTTRLRGRRTGPTTNRGQCHVPGKKLWPRAGLVLLALGLVAATGQAQATSSDERNGQLLGAKAMPRSSLDFKLYRGYMIVVPGSVANLTDLHLLVDTGTNLTMVDRRLAEKLGTFQHVNIRVLGETVSGGKTVLTDLKVGPLSTKSLPVLVLDLSSLEQALHLRIDMVIGLDVLGQSSFSINYETKRMRFGDPPALPLVLPMQSGPPFVSVTARLDGVPLRLLVNTGIPSLILHPAGGQSRIEEVKSERSNLVMNAAGLQFVCKRGSLHALRLADRELGRQTAFIVNDRRNVFDGSLPIPALGFKEVAFDFEHHLLRLRR